MAERVQRQLEIALTFALSGFGSAGVGNEQSAVGRKQ
jgi:hypothetical protein